jgi:phosphoribosylformimino-5-aminoimidazole carboxamide ribotide isomerase
VTFSLYSAIDLRAGRCVRLYQGDYGRETVYGDDPPAQAATFAAAGSPWIHVVDLDAARSGEPVNRPVIAAVAAAVGVPVQTGGGVRSEEAAAALFAAGVARVVVGTAAVTDPDLVPAIAERGRVAVGLDARGREVATRGWTEGSGIDVADAVTRFGAPHSPVDAIVVTQIDVDGTHHGPDLALYTELLALTATPLVASGGVGSLDDLARLRDLDVQGRRLDGVIVGRALYDGAFTAAAAVAVCDGGPVRPSTPPAPPG